MPKPILSPRLSLALAAAFSLAGCAIGPDFQRPAAHLPAAYAEAQTPETAPAALNPEWWQLFADATLNQLVDQTLAHNQDLLAAVARMEAAEAAAGIARAEYFPGVGLEASSGRTHTSGETFNGRRNGPSTYDTRRAALSVSYEVDFWGRIRRSNEAARAEALASRHGRDALRLSLIGQVTSEYLALRSLDAQLQATQETLESRKESLKIVTARLEAGAASAIDLAQAQSALAGAQAQWNQLRRQRALSENQLGLLTGRPELQVAAGDFRQLPLPPLPPAGLPSSLLEARPDVRQAEEKLVAANARIGVAKAAYFPSISLTGLLGSESMALSELFTGNAAIWSFGASLAMPIFNAGKTGAQVDQATALQKEAAASYQKTVQTAFREVKDALVTLKELSEEEAALARQVAASEEALRIAQVRYETGYSGFLEVLDSQRSLNSAQLQYLGSRKNRLAAAVDLFKALGGGWNPTALAAREQ